MHPSCAQCNNHVWLRPPTTPTSAKFSGITVHAVTAVVHVECVGYVV